MSDLKVRQTVVVSGVTTQVFGPISQKGLQFCTLIFHCKIFIIMILVVLVMILQPLDLLGYILYVKEHEKMVESNGKLLIHELSRYKLQ